MNLFKVLWALTPIGAIANLIERTNEHGKGDVVETIIGSAPYYPPDDKGGEWAKVKGPTASGAVEHQRVVRKGKGK